MAANSKVMTVVGGVLAVVVIAVSIAAIVMVMVPSSAPTPVTWTEHPNMAIDGGAQLTSGTARVWYTSLAGAKQACLAQPTCTAITKMELRDFVWWNLYAGGRMVYDSNSKPTTYIHSTF